MDSGHLKTGLFDLYPSFKLMKRCLYPLLAALLMGTLSTARTKQNDSLQTMSLLKIASLNTTSLNTPSQHETDAEIYRYHGLKAAEGPETLDGIYQDFSLEGDTVGKLWADPDAKSHEGEDFSWVQAHVNRSQSSPYLTVEFARHGYGTNMSVVPKNLIPETLPETAQLTFEVRSQDPVCVGIRFMDRDGELWAYGIAPLDYKRLCVEPGQQWTKFTVPLTPNRQDWFKFEYSGNVDLGNQFMEASLMAGLEFELGLAGDYYFTSGAASFDLREIKVEEGQEVED